MPILNGISKSKQDLFNRKSLRSALRNWDRSERLGGHPLARLQIVDSKRQASGYGETKIGYGIALREVLLEAIRELRPEDQEPDYLEKRWRPFLILSEQFIHGRNPDYLSELLGIARSTYNHEQAHALESLLDILNQREVIQSAKGIQDEERTPEVAFRVSIPFLAPPKPHYAIVGREQLLKDLKRQLITGNGLKAAAIYGLPGIGKTTLAVELAHDPEVMAHFKDGVLWAGLGRHPDVMALLSLWGGALGVSLDEISKLLFLEARAKAIHAAIGTRRMLLVIDDVWKAVEGLALKVGGPNCAYLVTTRLPGIAVEFAGEGAKAIEELNLMDGLRLLAQFSPSVVNESSEEARALVQDVGGLPLALVLMGRYLQKEAHLGQVGRLRRALDRLRLAEERMQLTQTPSPLDQQPSLPAGTPLSLHAVIAISDEALDETLQTALQALSVFPPKPNTFSEAAALHVSQITLEQMDQLVDSGLIESRPPNRFSLHQTIAEYARLKPGEGTVQERFVGFYVQYLEEHKGDFAVLDLEMGNISTALSVADRHGMYAELIRGANSLFPFMEAKGLFDVAEEHLRSAESVAREMKEEEGLLATLIHLGSIAHRRGDYGTAEENYQEALELGCKMDPEKGLGEIYKGLGIVAFSSGRYEEAEGWFRSGLGLTTKARDTHLESALLTNLGVLLFNLGKHAQAEKHFRSALRSARALQDRETISRLLLNLGVIVARRWQYQDAERFFQESLELARGAGRRDTMSFLLTNLGTLANDQGHLELAERYFQEGLSLAEETNDRARASHLLANLGALAGVGGDHPGALAYLDRGLKIAREIGHRENVSLLLTNLGVLSKDQGDFKEAAAFFEEALTLTLEMGHRRYEAVVLGKQGELLLLQEMWSAAREVLTKSLEIAREIHLQELVAAALYGLAQAAAWLGDWEEARENGKQSLSAYQEIKHPKADEVKEWLENL